MKKSIILAGILMLVNGAMSAGDRSDSHDDESIINRISRGRYSCRNDGYGNHSSDITAPGSGECFSYSDIKSFSRDAYARYLFLVEALQYSTALPKTGVEEGNESS